MKIVFLCLLMGLTGLIQALEIVIDTGSDNPIKIAVVPFSTFDETLEVSSIISFDLVRSGQFAPL